VRRLLPALCLAAALAAAGCSGLGVRSDDAEAFALAFAADDPDTRAAVTAERAFERSNPSEDPPWVDFDEGGLTGHVALLP